MTEQLETKFSSPAELTAILVAAHRSGDTGLERAAKQELLDRFDIRISFKREPRPEASHAS